MKSTLPVVLAPAIASIILVSAIGPNMVLCVIAAIVLAVGSFVLWRPGEAPILLFIFLYQWVQASAGALYANVVGTDIQALYSSGGQQTLASILSLVGVLFLALGLRYGAGPQDVQKATAMRRLVGSIPQHRWLQLCIGMWMIGIGARALALIFPGFSQLLLAISDLRWAAFVALTYATFASLRGGLGSWIAVWTAVFLMSIGGFFSNFKDVFIYTFLGVAAARPRIRPRTALLLLGGGIMLVVAGTVWTAIKVPYRVFLSGGERTQAVKVGYSDAVAELTDLIRGLSLGDLGEAVTPMIERIMYTEYFGVVLDRVPDAIPYENGKLWLDALSRPLSPRLLYPDKPVIDESMATNRYTGLNVAGFEDGASISLGYMTESYIDFGSGGMMLAIFFFGMALGRLHRWLLLRNDAACILGMALSSVVLMSAAYLETSLAKAVGGVVASILVSGLVSRFLGRHLVRWLTSRQIQAREGACLLVSET